MPRIYGNVLGKVSGIGFTTLGASSTTGELLHGFPKNKSSGVVLNKGLFILIGSHWLVQYYGRFSIREYHVILNNLVDYPLVNWYGEIFQQQLLSQHLTGTQYSQLENSVHTFG